ncbi:MAG TPA: UDP-N-acetylglucosamine 1-carboxyvinyltransferase [Candidatus Atribacteria bacterium]|nr:UDP-N-acetylglucosamine 1-carboxyvinyltransferase [Candidatus Atribacteria bacterium]HPT78369.1 UDP-N-acetylglucosamine 1-carboxyvinyltransferase [Candidatus Atribacteria bacterium]
MPSLLVSKSGPLKGEVVISGAKNSVLPILAASLLTDDTSRLDDIPDLEDVEVMCELLEHFGSKITREGSHITIDNNSIANTSAPYELVRKMRASFLVMGPILSRFGSVKISLPGGCAIGTRPIDLHLKGFASLGADITLGHGYIEARADRLRGNRIYLDFPSVGATENIIMAAALADGLTIIENAAEEPEIIDLANFINSMGGSVRGAGTDTIKIEGVKCLSGASHTIIPDRIEAGTFMVAAAITGGDIILKNVIADHLRPVEAKLKEAGISIYELDDGMRVTVERPLRPIDLKTLPYPGFPTDMQAQMMALMCVLPGTSIITETVFENRFMHVSELKRLGARIKIEGRSAIIEGVKRLTGTDVRATDLRAGAALLIAGLYADGTTRVRDIYHIDRGYERIEEKLKALGANIERTQ